MRNKLKELYKRDPRFLSGKNHLAPQVSLFSHYYSCINGKLKHKTWIPLKENPI